MTSLGFYSSSKRTTRTVCNRTVDDIDNGKRNDQEIVAETEAEPDSDRQLDYLVYGPDGFPENCSSSPGDRWWSPQNQLGLPENHFWIPEKYVNSCVQTDPVAESSKIKIDSERKIASESKVASKSKIASEIKIAVDFALKSEEAGNISIKLRMEGSHHIDPVVHLNFGPAMNLNFQLNKREREQEDAELLMPDCRPKKQQRLSK